MSSKMTTGIVVAAKYRDGVIFGEEAKDGEHVLIDSLTKRVGLSICQVR